MPHLLTPYTHARAHANPAPPLRAAAGLAGCASPASAASTSRTTTRAATTSACPTPTRPCAPSTTCATLRSVPAPACGGGGYTGGWARLQGGRGRGACRGAGGFALLSRQLSRPPLLRPRCTYRPAYGVAQGKPGWCLCMRRAQKCWWWWWWWWWWSNCSLLALAVQAARAAPACPPVRPPARSRAQVHRLMQLQEAVDIFVSHDWPVGIANYGNKAALLAKKTFLRAEVRRHGPWLSPHAHAYLPT